MKKIISLMGFLALTLLFSCQNDDNAETMAYQPTKVSVGLKQGINTIQLFQLINNSGMQADYVDVMGYESDLNPSQLDYAKQYLNAKPYIDANWQVYGFVDAQTSKIMLYPHLNNMHNPAYQADFIEAIHELKLHAPAPNGVTTTILFTVPAGAEIKWRNTFKQMAVVEWAQLNYYTDIITGNP